MWLAVDDADAANAAMEFVPGSHRLGALQHDQLDLDGTQRFWADEVGLRYEELLKVGGGVHQHRYALHGAVLKSNVSREPLDSDVTGLVRLRIAAPVEAPSTPTHPDGIDVELVPVGHDGIEATEITIAATSIDQTSALLAEAFDVEPERGCFGSASRSSRSTTSRGAHGPGSPAESGAGT